MQVSMGVPTLFTIYRLNMVFLCNFPSGSVSQTDPLAVSLVRKPKMYVYLATSMPPCPWTPVHEVNV
jgi:hypothetical protein